MSVKIKEVSTESEIKNLLLSQLSKEHNKRLTIFNVNIVDDYICKYTCNQYERIEVYYETNLLSCYHGWTYDKGFNSSEFRKSLRVIRKELRNTLIFEVNNEH